MKRGLHIDPRDNVGVVLEHVDAGDQVVAGDFIVIAQESIDLPHKIALCNISKGEHVLKYGAFIGYATQDIKAGQHVHVHNVDSEQMMK